MTRPFVVIKVGGSLLKEAGFAKHLGGELSRLVAEGCAPVVVHGGGTVADAWLKRLGIEVRKWKGRRITDDETLQVVKMAYRGLLQSDLVAALSAFGVPALGMCGSDGWVVAKKRAPVADEDAPEPVDYGWVGDVESVNPAPVVMAAQAGFVPVIACLATDGAGKVLNVNADSVAAKIAEALAARDLVFMTDVNGILRDLTDPASVVSRMTVSELRAMREKEGAADGMLPKAEAIERALTGGVKRVFVVHGFASLREEMGDAGGRGTRVTMDRQERPGRAHPRDALGLLRQILAIPSVSGNEEQIAEYLEEALHAEGITAWRDGRSVVAVRGRGYRTLLLNAHTDTVPPAKGWTVNPYAATERDGQIFGLGAVDCKGPLAALLAAFIEVVFPEEAGRLIFTATPEEETGGKDLARLVAALADVDAAIIAEPTHLRPCIAEKGVLRMDIEVVGKGAHASRPWYGENAIERAAEVVAALKALDFGAPHPMLGGVTITPTRIAGGDITNRVPEACAISLDIRYPPGIDRQDIVDAVTRVVPGVARVVSDRIKPLETPEGSLLMKALRRSFRAGDFAGMFGASNWACLGDIPAVVLGPGSPKCSHSADEHIAASDLVRGVEAYRRLCEVFFNA